MIEHHGGTFKGGRVDIDNSRFESCTFDGCAIVYSGTGPYHLNGCKFNNCSFTLDGAAALGLKFLSDWYKMAPQMVEATFDNVRRGIA